jgi:tetratricopeptide (TPR) repeat protein
MNRILVIFITLFCFAQAWAQQESPDLRRGNKEYKHENYTEAEVNYRRGLDKNNDSFEGHFNLGDALFRQEKYPEALEQYQKAERLLKSDDKTRKAELDKRLAATYHNMGNALYAQQQYDKSVAAYQQSLRHNPKDNDTRYNLVKAMQQLRQQQQQQNQQQNQEQKNDSTQQQQQQEQQKQEQQQNQQQDQQQNQEQMDRETAEQILQALEQDEQETQEKLQRQQGKKRRVEKNW